MTDWEQSQQDPWPHIVQNIAHKPYKITGEIILRLPNQQSLNIKKRQFRTRVYLRMKRVRKFSGGLEDHDHMDLNTTGERWQPLSQDSRKKIVSTVFFTQ